MTAATLELRSMDQLVDSTFLLEIHAPQNMQGLARGGVRLVQPLDVDHGVASLSSGIYRVPTVGPPAPAARG